MRGLTKKEAAAVEAGRARFAAELAEANGPGFNGPGFEAFQSRANAEFSLVADASNWKAPIAAEVTIAPEGLGFVLAAVTFFTGSVPTFELVGRGPVRFMVRAAGYYAAVGA